MKLLFWLSLSLIFYTYFGYLILLWLIARLRNAPVVCRAYQPSVSVIIAAHNEESKLQPKIDNVLKLDYPKHLLQIVIVSDGSTDHTPEILKANPTVDRVILDQAKGKAIALNEAVKQASGEISVFFDVRQRIALNAISELTSCFCDPEVGAASGELSLDSTHVSGVTESLGFYWRLEKALRKLESETGSVVGVTGAIYAIRTSLYQQIPVGTILDDVFVPMNIARTGKRIVFCPSAIAYDQLSDARGKEFSRKVRTLTGNYQLLDLAPWLLTASNPLRFRFVSHKLLRLVVPFLLILVLTTSLWVREPAYRLAFWTQICFYCLALSGLLWPATRTLRPVAIAYTFTFLNASAAVAFYNFLKKRYSVWI